MVNEIHIFGCMDSQVREKQPFWHIYIPIITKKILPIGFSICMILKFIVMLCLRTWIMKQWKNQVLTLSKQYAMKQDLQSTKNTKHHNLLKQRVSLQATLVYQKYSMEWKIQLVLNKIKQQLCDAFGIFESTLYCIYSALNCCLNGIDKNCNEKTTPIWENYSSLGITSPTCPCAHLCNRLNTIKT